MFCLSIIKHVTLQKIVAHDFRYVPRIMTLNFIELLNNEYRVFFFSCLTDKRWSEALQTSRRTRRLGEV